MKELLQIKRITALLLTIVFCYLSAIKYVSTTEFLSVFTMVIGFYFGQSSIRQTLKEQNNNNLSNIKRNVYSHIIIKEELIEYLRSKEIKTTKQKELLLKVLEKQARSNKKIFGLQEL